MRTHQVYKFIFALLFIAINSTAQNVSRYYENGKTGFKNTATGQVVVPAHYTGGSEMTQTPDGKYLALVTDGLKAGYINDKGEVIIPLTFDEGSAFSEGLARVRMGTKYGYINAKGEAVIRMGYDFARDFKSGIARVGNDGKYGFINTTGNAIIPFQYYNAGDFANGLAPVMNADAKWGFIDMQGNMVIQPVYTKAENFENGEALVYNGEKFIYVDTKGNYLRDMNVGR